MLSHEVFRWRVSDARRRSVRAKASRFLVAEAREAFRKWNWSLVTGAEGLGREKLRLLERAGIVEHTLAKLPSGSIVSRWRWKGER